MNLARGLGAGAEDVGQHLGDGDIGFDRDLAVELDLRQHLGERRVVAYRDAVLARERQDRLGDVAGTLGDDARCGVLTALILDRDRDRLALGAAGGDVEELVARGGQGRFPVG
jgi:hypothetical protein